MIYLILSLIVNANAIMCISTDGKQTLSIEYKINKETVTYSGFKELEPNLCLRTYNLHCDNNETCLVIMKCDQKYEELGGQYLAITNPIGFLKIKAITTMQETNAYFVIYDATMENNDINYPLDCVI